MSEATTRDGESSGETTTGRIRGAVPGRRLRWGAYLVALAGVGLVVNGVAILYRAIFASGFEAGVETLDGVTRTELAASHPRVVHYLDHLHVNVAGLLIAVGIGVATLACYGIRRGHRWALATAVALPAVFLAHSIPIHRTAEFSFHPVAHLGPGAVWLPLLLTGAILAALGHRDGQPQKSE